MSYQVSDIENFPLSSPELSQFMCTYFTTLTASAEFLSALPLPSGLKNNVKMKPNFVFKEICGPFFEAIINFEVNPSDVFVCSIAKSGSSWMQTIVWLLTHDLNFDAIRSVDRGVQMGDFDELHKANIAKAKADELIANDKSNMLDEQTAWNMSWNAVFADLDKPRIIKSHYPVYFLPKTIWSRGAKIIYVVSNPKDAIVSLYYMLRNFFHANVTLDDVVTATINDTICCSPHLDHILDFWRVRHLPNILFVAYEDLVSNQLASVKQISDFLGCNYSDEQLMKLTEFISFDSMKRIKSVNREEDVARMEDLVGKKRPNSEFTFLRKGKAGGYRDDLNEDQIKRIEFKFRI